MQPHQSISVTPPPPSPAGNNTRNRSPRNPPQTRTTGVYQAEPITVTEDEQHQILGVINYRKTLIWFSTLDFIICLINVSVYPPFILVLLIIMMGYYGAKDYRVGFSYMYMIYNSIAFVLKFLLFNWLLFTLPQKERADQSDDYYTTPEKSSGGLTNSSSDTNVRVSGFTYLIVFIDMTISFWTARIGYRFATSLQYLKNNSVLFDRFLNNNFQIVENTDNQWNREYLW